MIMHIMIRGLISPGRELMGMRVGVVGATGYTGIELLRLLNEHPHVEVAWAVARRDAGRAIGHTLPHLLGTALADLVLSPPEDMDNGILPPVDYAFLALPHGAAGPAAQALRAQGAKVIDLSADFRLKDQSVHQAWYGTPDEEMPPASLREEAVYGLPELFRDQIRDAALVANPGCYPTVSALAAAPLVAHGLVDVDDLIFDCKSGVSGAGRNASMTVHYGEVNESLRAYTVAGKHRHIPEIEQTLTILAGKQVRITFTPHLMPMTRGVLATMYARLAGKEMDEEDLLRLYREFYAGAPCVRVYPQGMLPATKAVQGSNYCDIGLALDRRTGRLLVVAAIDNLVKGASGQAVQNMNIMAGLPEDAGLKISP